VVAEVPKMRQQDFEADPQIDSKCERGNDSPTIANCPAEMFRGNGNVNCRQS